MLVLTALVLLVITWFLVGYSSFDFPDQLSSRPPGEPSHHPHIKWHNSHQDAYFPSVANLDRYVSHESWRSDDSYVPTHPGGPRVPMPPPEEFSSKGQYLKQPLVADFRPGAEKIFLMIKTGSNVLWNRLPVHLFTTLTKVPNFALYADHATSIGGYEVVDVLQNMTQTTKESKEFAMYRKMKAIHDNRANVDPGEVIVEDDDGWNLDKFKNIPMLSHAYHTSPNSDWFVFMDADSYFFFDNLVDYLSMLDPNQPLYLGSPAMLGDIVFAHGGTGVVVSRKALELTVGQHPEIVEEYEKKTFNYCCGDAMVALMLKEKINLDLSIGGDAYPHVGYKFQGNPPYDVEIHPNRFCQKILSFHHLKPSDIEQLYEYEKIKGPSRSHITYADIYQDFVLPHIEEWMPNWNSRVKGADTWKEGEELKDGEKVLFVPAESGEKCQRACESKDSCLSWRYSPTNKECQISAAITLGRQASSWIKTTGDYAETESISGFNIKHIVAMRKKQKCDPLYKMAEGHGASEDGAARTEGWYRRLASKYQGKLKVDEENKA